MKAGLLGYPIAHSLSPVIHTAAYRALGLDWEYALYPCEDKAAFLRALAEAKADPSAFVGFNVTTPYKVDAYGACDGHSRHSAALGNANVLTFVESVSAAGALAGGAPAAGASAGGSRLISDNTDGRGLVTSLEREGGLAVAGSSVVLCGMGPVALSVLLALIDARAASVSVVSRNVERGVEWVRHLRERLERDGGVSSARDAAPAAGNSAWPSIEVIDYAQASLRLATAQALIDATPLGMSPTDGAVVAPEALREGLVVLDVVYGHGETALIRAAREAGAIGIDGLGMLIEQAALTIEIWARAQGIPVEAPRTLMRQAALNRL